ncbi:MAG: tetratricopeptide repeat protein [Porticoccaceae bacterium]
MSKSGLISGVIVTTTLIVSNFSQAQSFMVDSSDSMAVDCYERSLEALSVTDARFADIQVCDAAINEGNLSPNDLMATLVNRGLIYATLGQLDRAAEDYNRALAIVDNVPEIYLNQGNLEFLAENWNQAISHYNQAEALGLIQLHVLHLNRGMALENSERLDEARAEYMAALELVPEWQPALERLQGIETNQPEQTTQEVN